MKQQLIYGVLIGLLVAVIPGYFVGKQVYRVGSKAGGEEMRLRIVAELAAQVPVKADTVYVDKIVERIRIVKTPVKDSTRITEVTGDTIRTADVQTRELKEVLYAKTGPDSSKVGDLMVKYFFPPVDRMQIDFDAAPARILYVNKVVQVPITTIVERKARWYEKPWPWISVGVLVGSVSMAAVK
jgi:hypothetical protein